MGERKSFGQSSLRTLFPGAFAATHAAVRSHSCTCALPANARQVGSLAFAGASTQRLVSLPSRGVGRSNETGSLRLAFQLSLFPSERPQSRTVDS